MLACRPFVYVFAFGTFYVVRRMSIDDAGDYRFRMYLCSVPEYEYT